MKNRERRDNAYGHPWMMQKDAHKICSMCHELFTHQNCIDVIIIKISCMSELFRHLDSNI